MFCLPCNTKIGVPWLPKILLQYLRQHGTPIFGCQECCQAAPKHCEELVVNHEAQTCLGCPSKCITHTPTLEHEKRTCTHRTYCMHTCLPSLEQRISKTRHGNIYSVASTHTHRMKHLSWALWIQHCTCRGRKFGGNSREFDGGFGEFDGFNECVEL